MIAGATLQSQGGTGNPDQRDRFVSAAALFVTSSMMLNVAADEESPKDSLSQRLVPIEDTTLRNAAGGEPDHIGDGVRSEISSSHFFQSIDSDGDGTLQAPELASIVRESIAETTFDTGVEDEVSHIMKKLDRDKEGVDSSDVFAYWMQLESLLTVDEVAEWVVHAVQMPDYVGDIFRENFVTGYDFPELVENGGQALLSELKIEKPSFRKKIIRHVYARLLGIGSVPSPPNEVNYNLESCSTASFSWKKSIAGGFPVHSYRVQRRAIDLHRTESLGSLHSSLSTEHHGDGMPTAKDSQQIDPVSDQCVEDGVDSVCAETVNLHVSSDWITVYVGGETEFVDTSLELGKNYLYRFQAWNSVGRSAPWVTVDISRSLKKQKCSTQRNIAGKRNVTSNETTVLGFLYWSSGTLISGSYFLMQVLLTGIALVSAVMRFKRASAKSTASAGYEVVPPSFWTGLNTFFARALGVEVVPSSELGENSTLRYSKSLHDKSVNAVGLNGYKHDSNMPRGDPQGRRLAFQKRQAMPASDSALTDGFLKTHKSFSFRASARNLSAPLESCQEEHTDHGDCFVPFRGVSPHRASRESSVNSQDSDVGGEMLDDHTRCNSCRKSYKFGKRWQHHCARCMSTFCHKHGRTTHSNFTSCKVPGTCVCNVCLLEIEQFNQSLPSTRTTPKGSKRWLGRKQRSMDTKSSEGTEPH